jgi:protein transport protein DSL1/ZW10
VKPKTVDRTSNNSLDSWQDPNTSDGNQDDDSADAWGWGDDEAGDSENIAAEDETSPEGAEAPVHDRMTGAVREVTLTEKYTISSMPDPVYNTIKSIVEDGATLTREM